MCAGMWASINAILTFNLSCITGRHPPPSATIHSHIASTSIILGRLFCQMQPSHCSAIERAHEVRRDVANWFPRVAIFVAPTPAHQYHPQDLPIFGIVTGFPK
jgi:hypothetical protein